MRITVIERCKEFTLKTIKFFKKIFYKKLILSLKNFNENIKEKDEEKENEKSINSSSRKYNTYLYESFSEKSSLTAYPNTEGSARLHKVYELLEMQRKPKNDENNLSEIPDNNSTRSIKSVEEKKGAKLFEKIKEQENLNVNSENNSSSKKIIYIYMNLFQKKVL